MRDPEIVAAEGPERKASNEVDVDATAAGPTQEVAGQEGKRRAKLHTSNSTIKRDAAIYGVNWKPPKEFTFWSPAQAKERHIKWLKLLGRVGWAAKGVIYALIGGLACNNAVGMEGNASPQGAFVLIGTASGGRGALVVLAIAIATYAVWRFWEGAVGQGYDDTFSNWKNFFKFRLSPIVSGAVYVAYDVLVIEVIPRDADGQRDFAANDSWPNSWHDSDIGKAGLVLVGIAFLAAVIVQLEQFLTKSFHNTIRDEYPRMPKKLWKPFRIFVLTTGHIGVLGRAGIFLFAAILFFRTVRSRNEYNQSAFGAAFAQLQSSNAGNAALFIMGFFVCVYGLFAVLNVYARIFPTPPPSRLKKQRRYAATGGEPPIVPQFAPGSSGFHPLSGPSERKLQPGAHGKFSPMTNAIANGGAASHTMPTVPENRVDDFEMGIRESKPAT